MGILNVTPDSFSDGGRHDSSDAALARARTMEEEGASILDIGGESTRPGAAPVPAEEQLRRVMPVVQALAGQTSCLLSIDTRSAAVADQALAAGAHIVNDVSALTHDPDLASVAAAHGVGVVLMHMQGTPETMQREPRYRDVVDDVVAYLEERLAVCLGAGIDSGHIALDPGVGFGKTVEQNLALLRGLPRLAALGCPVLIGLSRKSFLGALVAREPEARLAAGLGAQAFAVLRGAHILRVHDVKETCDAMRIVDILDGTDS